MRRLICLLMTAMLLTASFGAQAESTPSPVGSLDEKVERVTVQVDRAMDHLTMGNPNSHTWKHFF